MLTFQVLLASVVWSPCGLDHELTVEEGGVTANMKLRRSNIAKTYADIVDSLYDAEEED